MVATHTWKTIKHGSSADQRELPAWDAERGEGHSPFRQHSRQTRELVALLAELKELIDAGASISNRNLAEAAVRLTVLDDAVQPGDFNEVGVSDELLAELIGGLTGTESDEITYGIVGTQTVHNIGLPDIPDDVFLWDIDEDDDLGYYESTPTHLLDPSELGFRPLRDCVGTTGQVDCPNGYYSGDDEYLGDTRYMSGFQVRSHP